MYQFKGCVRYSETAEDGLISLPAVMNLFQDCSDFQTESLGKGHDVIGREHRAWLLAYWHVIFDRYPAIHEAFTAETRPWKFSHFFGYRNFGLIDADGVYTVRANSLWTLIDTERMHPVRVTDEDISVYKLDKPLDMDYSDQRKIAIPDQMQEMPPVPVLRSQIDLNHHVNNVQYILIASAFFPEGRPAELRVEYCRAAVYGDSLYPRVGQSDGRTVVALCSQSGDPYAVIEVKMADLHDGRGAALEQNALDLADDAGKGASDV